MASSKGRTAAPPHVEPAANVDEKTVAGFGEEWSRFDQTKLVGEEYEDLFQTYFSILSFDDLPQDAEGFDLGCGSGRWAWGVAPKVGRLHCIDASAEALDVARKRLAGFENVDFHLASASDIPLSDGSQDFGYSLGVLHHIPETARALAEAVRKLKPGAPFLLYIYYKLENRPRWYRAIWRGTDVIRRLVSRLAFAIRYATTAIIAVTVYWPLARFSRAAENLGFDPSNVPLSAYRHRSFYTMRTDALDRFGTRLEQRFSRQEIDAMMLAAGLADIKFRETAPYWLACGRRRASATIDSRPFTLSVVIPLYNKEAAIECTLKSVLHQTREPDEVIIVDDGSTDASSAAVEHVLQSEQTRIPVRLIRQANQGVSAARNRGAEESRSEYIAFLDADDEWLPDCAAELEKLARAFPAATVLTVLCARNSPAGVLPLPTALPHGFFGELPRPLETYRKGYGIIQSSSVAIRRDAWRKLGGFPVGAQRGEDISSWLKLMIAERFAHSGRPLSVWHDEYSGAAAREGVPHHFSYFLGDPEGRKDLANSDVVKFLASNLAVQIGGFRLAQDSAAVTELRRLSAVLPLRFRLPSLVALVVPTWVLREAQRWRSGQHG
jgi:ubiquinone/menaquinone biosynthesis C-methylase UbiE